MTVRYFKFLFIFLQNEWATFICILKKCEFVNIKQLCKNESMFRFYEIW
jgi:hypothetical protein